MSDDAAAAPRVLTMDEFLAEQAEQAQAALEAFPVDPDACTYLPGVWRAPRTPRPQRATGQR